MSPIPMAGMVIPVISIALALLAGGVFLALSGKNPLEIYFTLFQSAFGSSYGFSETVVKAIPLALCALGVSLAFRVQLWNIGAEGQFYMGAMAATWVALTYPEGSRWVVLPAMFLAAAMAGGLWGLLPAIPRAFWKVNETITTLMLNYIAIFWVDFLIYGPWKDPNGYNFPLTAPFELGATLPSFGTSRVHYGLILALIAALLVYIILKYTVWGYQLKVVGESQRAAKYAGMSIVKTILLVMLISGALAGIAGMTEVAGITQRLQQGLSPGYGYSAIIIAWLARLNPWAILLVSFLFGGLLSGGFSLQSMGLPAASVYMLQGLILFFILGGEIFNSYRLKWIGGRS
ncbi:MAG: ABC transporter permease [Clostridia bacterium]|nr:ABC transporter permease [Clostridia bacterium]